MDIAFLMGGVTDDLNRITIKINGTAETLPRKREAVP